MPTYTAIPNTQIEPEAPVTSELMTLLRDNPLAIQEGDPTAPKMVSKARDKVILYGSRSGNGDIDFSDLSAYGGVEFELNGSAVSSNLEVNLNYSTDNGSSYIVWKSGLGASRVASAVAGVLANGYIDFSTGYARSITSDGDVFNILSDATPPIAVTNLRFAYVNQSGNCAVILKPYGAIS